MIVGYGEPYTGTQVETPETAKGEPKVGIQGYAEAAEVVEGRGLAKGNLGGCNRDRTQCRDTLQQALDRVRQAARRVRLLLTALWHHVYDIDRLQSPSGAGRGWRDVGGLRRGVSPDFSPVVWKKAVPRGIICSGSTGYADRRGRPYEHRV